LSDGVFLDLIEDVLMDLGYLKVKRNIVFGDYCLDEEKSRIME